MEQWLLINGSPRPNGHSAHVASLLTRVFEAEYPDVEVTEFDVGTCDVLGCNGCDFCRTDEECIMSDDMDELLERFVESDRVILVTPTYFAGLPSQTKAVLDRLQPLYWPWKERHDAGIPQPPKRPLTLFILGDGGDPHGYDGLITTVRSAVAVAGLSIDTVVKLIGRTRISRKDLGPWSGEGA